MIGLGYLVEDHVVLQRRNDFAEISYESTVDRNDPADQPWPHAATMTRAKPSDGPGLLPAAG